MRNPKRKLTRLMEERTLLVKSALEQGLIERGDICKASGLTLYDLGNLFQENKELAAEYKVRKKVLLDMATDNISHIVSDRNHPQNYQASKYIIDKFKNEFDDNFERRDDEDEQIKVEVSQPGESSAKPFQIVFKGGK